MKVLCVLESASRIDGGIFEAERALQRELVLSQGCAVNVVALRDDFTDLDSKKWLPICPQTAKVLGPKGFGFAPELSYLMEGQFDLAYCAALWKYPSWTVLNWQKKTSKPVVVAPHGSLDAWALNNSRWKKRLASWLFKQEQLERATCFRALCTAEADAIRSYGLNQRIEVVPNGVDLPELFTIIEQRGRCEIEQLKVGPKGEEAGATESKSTEGKKRLLFLGRIHPKKGLVNALRAWAEICNSRSAIRDSAEWQFVIAGWDQGGHENELNALCAELGLRTAKGFSRGGTESTEGQNLKINSYKLKTTSPEWADVIFFGPAFGGEKEQLLRSADAFILPSFSEGLPMSVLEAWSYGLPVLMTPECNLPEGFACKAALEIRSGEGSFQGSDFSFQKGLRTLLEMADQERVAMGMRGRKLVEEKFTWQKVAAQMRALYEDILSR
jgi:poly(glycerol-phosphate) alpha-glucosyltransferase